jgi:5-methylcytosine-specific restriction endonuclease McrA
MKLYVAYTKEQIEWIRKHALDDKYKAWVKDKRKKKKKVTSKVKSKSKPIPNKPKKKKERIPYYLQLKDKRWLKRREEIFAVKGKVCSQCGATSNLHVHHLRYLYGKMAWEYKDKDLVVLCDHCHKATHCIDLDEEFNAITNF